MAMEQGRSNEEVLVRAAREGNVDAFGELVERYEQQVFRLVRHMAENRQDAEDITQEAFIKAFCNIRSFEGRAAFSTWLIRIAVNEALGRIRRRRKFPVNPLELAFPDGEGTVEMQIANPSANPEELCRERELRETLARAVHRLHPRSRIVFVLRDVHGLSAVETAEVLGVSLGTVKTRLFRARQRMRQLLMPYLSTPGGRLRALSTGKDVRPPQYGISLAVR